MIWVAAAAVYNNLRVSHANTAILQTAQAVRSLMATSAQMGSAGDMTSTFISAGAIPADLVSGTSAIGPWAGSTLKVLTVAATDTAFTIEINNIPQAGCIALLDMVGGQGRDPGLTAVGAKTASTPIVAATAGTALTLSTTALSTTLTPAISATACSATTPTNIAQFEFTIK